jgi:hypothetical protein
MLVLQILAPWLFHRNYTSDIGTATIKVTSDVRPSVKKNPFCYDICGGKREIGKSRSLHHQSLLENSSLL